ncbi:MAG: hypothetical protein ACI87E_003052 [Mariniblastus sp.]|jgi:hypothetical protein
MVWKPGTGSAFYVVRPGLTATPSFAFLNAYRVLEHLSLELIGGPPSSSMSSGGRPSLLTRVANHGRAAHLFSNATEVIVSRSWNVMGSQVNAFIIAHVEANLF